MMLKRGQTKTQDANGDLMQATETLKHEHDLIERVLVLLSDAAKTLQGGGHLPFGFQEWAVDFIRRFADGCHHAKEEEVLFPLLEQRGVARHGGPIGVMLYEHDIGRDCVGRMAAALPSANNNPAAFAAAAQEYVALLRQHIFKENNVLFRIADRVLKPGDDEDVVSRYRTADGPGGDALHRQYEVDVCRWEDEFSASK
ncbi:MAG: hemerythrin domain-containing protein [Pirellulales bacterium]|nr:hemerythrin domain-containing protein [Pirellulales bacterium]